MEVILIGRWQLNINYEIFKIFFKELWNNQPTTVIGLGVSIAVLLGIYIFLLNTYK